MVKEAQSSRGYGSPAADEHASIPPILVVGVGNILMKDEGVGVHAAQRLLHIPFPPSVEIVDGGTAGIALLDFLENRKKIIIIDAIRTPEPSGTIFRLAAADIGPKADGKHYSLHQAGIPDLLRIAEAIGQSIPEVVIFALQPADISMGTELSAVIEKRLPRLLELVTNEIKATKLGP